jgi:HD-like signal output (HDOD) protein
MRIAAIDRELDIARGEGAVRDITIPPCPELLSELRQQVNQADPEPAEIARIASSDVAMAAALMRFVNSPLYTRSRPAQTVQQAIAMLGVGPAMHLLTGFLTRNSFPVQSALLEHFWESSTRRALAMAHIARQLYSVDADLAHTFGLFCHVGLPIMLQGVRGYAGTLTEALARQDRSFTDTENAAHRTDHAVVGAIVARTWRLPVTLTSAVRLHHDFTVLGDHGIPAEVRTLVAAGLVAEYLVQQFEQMDEPKEWRVYGPACLRHLQVNAQELAHWADALLPAFGSAGVP